MLDYNNHADILQYNSIKANYLVNQVLRNEKFAQVEYRIMGGGGGGVTVRFILNSKQNKNGHGQKIGQNGQK